MNDRRPKRTFRYGIATVLIVVAVCGIAFTIWNPLAPTASEFLSIKMLTSNESVRETFGEPCARMEA